MMPRKLMASGALLAAALTCTLATEPNNKGYAYRVLVSLNQLANTISGGAPDETISSRAGRAKLKGKRAGRAICWVLERFDRCHCTTAIEYDEEGNPLPHQLPRLKDK